MTLLRDESLLVDLARPLVAEFAPAEGGELFTILGEAHFARPEAFADADHRSGPLAFGLPEFTVLLTPVLLATMTEIVKYVVGQAMAKGTRASANGIRRLFGTRQRRAVESPVAAPAAEPTAAPAEEPIALTARQWAEVHGIVVDVMQRGGVPVAQASLIADAVVGRGKRGDGPE